MGAAAVAARTLLRSAGIRGAANRISPGFKPRVAPSPFGISSRNPLPTRISRSPLEMSRVSAVSLLPYHSAAASAVLTSLLSRAPNCHAWNIEGNGGRLQRCC